MRLDINETALANSINNLDECEIFELFRIIIADLEYDKLKSLQDEIKRQLKYNYNEIS